MQFSANCCSTEIAGNDDVFTPANRSQSFPVHVVSSSTSSPIPMSTNREGVWKVSITGCRRHLGHRPQASCTVNRKRRNQLHLKNGLNLVHHVFRPSTSWWWGYLVGSLAISRLVVLSRRTQHRHRQTTYLAESAFLWMYFSCCRSLVRPVACLFKINWSSEMK